MENMNDDINIEKINFISNDIDLLKRYHWIYIVYSLIVIY